MLFSHEAFRNLPNKIPIGSALWEFKHTVKQLKILKNGSRHTFYSQYQQRSRSPATKFFEEEWWQYYDQLPANIDRAVIYCDTAMKTESRHDYSVFQFWVRSPGKGIFLVDQWRGKFQAPMLESKLVEFWHKHQCSRTNLQGATEIKIEDKSSGTGLIQTLKKDYLIPVSGIPRSHDKFMRAFNITPKIASGWCHLPRTAEFLYDYKEEFSNFTSFMTHKHDDQIDATIDAIDDLLLSNETLYNDRNVGE